MTEKKRFFSVSRWNFARRAVILYALFCSGVGSAGEEWASGDGVPAAGQVQVKVKDAEKLDAVLALRERIRKLEKSAAEANAKVRQLSSERDLLRQELFDAVTQLEAQNAEVRRLQLGIAEVLASGHVQNPTVREDQLSAVLSEVSECGGSLAVLAAEFCREVDAVIGKMPKENGLTGLKLKRDLLLAESRKFSALTRREKSKDTVNRCRILTVDPELGLVVLPVGLVHGVSSGLIFFVRGAVPEKPSGRLRVVATRPLVAAAVLIDGDPKQLAPGMEVATDLQHFINREQ